MTIYRNCPRTGFLESMIVDYAGRAPKGWRKYQ